MDSYIRISCRYQKSRQKAQNVLTTFLLTMRIILLKNISKPQQFKNQETSQLTSNTTGLLLSPLVFFAKGSQEASPKLANKLKNKLS